MDAFMKDRVFQDHVKGFGSLESIETCQKLIAQE